MSHTLDGKMYGFSKLCKWRLDCLCVLHNLLWIVAIRIIWHWCACERVFQWWCNLSTWCFVQHMESWNWQHCASAICLCWRSWRLLVRKKCSVSIFVSIMAAVAPETNTTPPTTPPTVPRTTLRPDGDLSALGTSWGLTSRLRFKKPFKRLHLIWFVM